MFALDRGSRRLLAVAALLVLAAAFATMPLKVRSEGGDVAPAVPPTAPRPAAAFIAVMPRRDPFAGGTPPMPRLAMSTARPALPSSSVVPALPPMPLAPPSVSPAHVTAIVTGARPYALVEDAGLTRVVTVGERISDERIVAIDIDGVHLEHGTTLSVSPSFAPAAGVR